jgi:hypothetical protein
MQLKPPNPANVQALQTLKKSTQASSKTSNEVSPEVHQLHHTRPPRIDRCAQLLPTVLVTAGALQAATAAAAAAAAASALSSIISTYQHINNLVTAGALQVAAAAAAAEVVALFVAVALPCTKACQKQLFRAST